MNNNILILSLSAMGFAIIAAFVAITIFYEGDKGLAIAGLVTVAGLIVPQLLSLKSSTDNAIKLEKVDAKLDNAIVTTEKVDQKVDINTVKTDKTHDLVDGQMTAFRQMLVEFSAVQQQLVGAQQLAQGITIGREQVTAEGTPPGTPVVSPADAAALGAAKAVEAAPADASPGVVADVAAKGAADATKA